MASYLVKPANNYSYYKINTSPQSKSLDKFTSSRLGGKKDNSQQFLGQRYAKIAVIKFAHYCLGIHAPYITSFSLNPRKSRLYRAQLNSPASAWAYMHSRDWLPTGISLYTHVRDKINIKHYYTGLMLTVGHRTISGQKLPIYLQLL